MEPLDLRQGPPRDPRERIAGLMMLARTVDKARALLPGGDPGSYWISPGLSAYLLGRLRISEEEFVAAVREAQSDDDVAAFVRARVDPGRIERIDATIGTLSVAQVTQELRERFVRTYGERPPGELIIDVLAQDDRKTFGRR